VWLRRTGRGICAYIGGSFPIAHDLCLRVCVCVGTKVVVGLFKSKSSTHFHPIFKHAQHKHAAPALPLGETANTLIHARCPKRLPLFSVGRRRCVLQKQASHHHHHRRRRRCNNHLLLQLLLKVFIVARVIFKRLNPGAAEDVKEVRWNGFGRLAFRRVSLLAERTLPGLLIFIVFEDLHMMAIC